MPDKTIKDILSLPSEKDIISELRNKDLPIPEWSELKKQYDSKNHDIMNTAVYQDKEKQKVSRVPMAMEALAARRLTGLTFGIPVERVYKSANEEDAAAERIIEAIYARNRIDALNFERGIYYYAGCELATMWYMVQQKNTSYGEECEYKLRCRTYSPMNDDNIYPLFDSSGDLIALSFAYTSSVNGKDHEFFEAFTEDKHIIWERVEQDWVRTLDENIRVGKIPASYQWSKEPCWGNNSPIRAELERVVSDNSNYIHDNSAPLLGVFSDENIDFGKEDKKAFRRVLKYPSNARLEYTTWQQSTESIKLQTETLRREFYTNCQIPDISYENMKSTPMSGESRKMLFIDAQLKVLQESGRLLEFLDRETQVIIAFAKIMFPQHEEAFNRMQVESVITPYRIDDERERIERILLATGDKPIASQREGIEKLGWSADPQKTLAEIAEAAENSVFNYQ